MLALPAREGVDTVFSHQHQQVDLAAEGHGERFSFVVVVVAAAAAATVASATADGAAAGNLHGDVRIVGYGQCTVDGLPFSSGVDRKVMSALTRPLPRKFLCEFLLAGALLLVGWTYVSDLYLELLLGGFNLGLWFTYASIFLRSGELSGQGVVCPDVIAAAALFAASSGRSLHWRLGGTAVAVILLWFL